MSHHRAMPHMPRRPHPYIPQQQQQNEEQQRTRRNAVDYTAQAAAIQQQKAERPRRNAVDLGLAFVAQPSTPNPTPRPQLHFDYDAVPAHVRLQPGLVLRAHQNNPNLRIPEVVLDASAKNMAWSRDLLQVAHALTPGSATYTSIPLRRDIPPSHHPAHPYTFLHLHTPSQHSGCPACLMDVFVADMKRIVYPTSPIDTTTQTSNDKRTNQIHVPFNYANRGKDELMGVWISDVIGFRVNVDGAGCRVSQIGGGVGALKVKLKIQDQLNRTLLEITDVLYATCEHRTITTFNLAYALAASLTCIAQAHKLNPENLRLLWIKNGFLDDGWVAEAAVVPRAR
ncbi:hypothetical protein R3P38DRAFT_1620893 [Favolaschia claudopus]|uniref:Uncharacterized protein n=1 Tax=Favolaschia claudopus TaxID=2862362 RepID=A0AAW0AG44_9AGAR